MNPRIATVCRYYPGNDYQLATGTVVSANAHQTTLRIDRTDVVFPKPPWLEVIE